MGNPISVKAQLPRDVDPLGDERILASAADLGLTQTDVVEVTRFYLPIISDGLVYNLRQASHSMTLLSPVQANSS